MNILFAKIKNNNKNIFINHKIIITGESCYKSYDLNDVVAYDPNTLLEDGQWYKISNFSKQDYCIELFKQINYDSVNFQNLDKKDFINIDYICSYEKEDVFFIQKISKAQTIRKKRIFYIDKAYKLDDSNSCLVINDFADAIYIRSKDALYFQKLEKISTIFKGIEKLYREATNEEVEKFLEYDFIKLDSKMNVSKVGKLNRNKIAITIDIFNKFSLEQKKQIVQYTKDNTGIELDDEGKFIIKDNEDVKKLLLGFNERYYETPISGEQRIANSIINIKNNTIND